MATTTDEKRKTNRELLIDFKQDEGDLIVQVPMAASGLLINMGESLLNQEMTNDISRYFNRTTAPYIRFPKIFEIVDQYVELLPKPGSEVEYAAVLRWLDHHRAHTMGISEPDEAQADPALYNNIRQKRPLTDSFREDGNYDDILNWDVAPWSNVIMKKVDGLPPLAFLESVFDALLAEGHRDLAVHFAKNAQRWARFVREHPDELANRYKYEWLAIASQYVVLAL